MQADTATLYGLVLTWYDEMTFRTLYEQAESTTVPDRGQTWQEAAQEWMDACQEVHLSVSSVGRLLQEDAEWTHIKRRGGDTLRGRPSGGCEREE